MRGSWLAISILVAASLGAGAAQALPADKHVTLEGDNGQSCLSEQKADCFRVVNGSLEGFVQGMTVHLTMENVGSAPHNAFVTEGSNADSNNIDTPADVAINNTATVDGGSRTRMVFQVPADAESLYIWCDVGNHETAGMWLSASVEAASNGTGSDGGDSGGADANSSTGPGTTNGSQTNGTDGGSSDEEESSIPSPGALALVSAMVGAALVARRDG